MNRKRIELHPGAIAPVARGLWHAAAEKLDEAAQGIKEMESARDRIEYEKGWAKFVDSIEEFWTRFFDEGKSRFSSFQPWAGDLNRRRREDELLRYLIESRHQSQHGRIRLRWTGGLLHIAPGFCGVVKNLKVFADGTYVIDAESSPGSSTVAQITLEPGSAQLDVIHNQKSKLHYQPPRNHDGEEVLTLSPIAVARKAQGYYKDVLQRAYRKFDSGR